jgi:hypothetical protein
MKQPNVTAVTAFINEFGGEPIRQSIHKPVLFFILAPCDFLRVFVRGRRPAIIIPGGAASNTHPGDTIRHFQAIHTGAVGSP